MDLSSLLVVGFLLCVPYALDPDHVASVAAISTSSRTPLDGLKQGAAWGVGHTLTLLLIGGSVLLLGLAVPENLALILLTVASTPSISTGITYIFVFGIGSVVGMGLLSIVIALPLRLTSNRFERAQRNLRLGVGIVTMVLGLIIVRSILIARL